MQHPLRVLIVEDRSADAELMVLELRRSGFQPDWIRVDTEADYVSNLSLDFDIILSDYELPGFSGLRALELLCQRRLDIPFIIVSGTIGEDTAVAAMKNGASDYLLKDRLTRLGPAVSLALEKRRLRKEGEQAEHAMRLSEHKYRHLFESLSEAAFLIEGASRRIVDANICAERLLGRTRSEILGMNERDLFPAGDSGGVAATTMPGPLEECALVSKDGRQIPVQIGLAPVDLDGRNLVLALMTDITTRKQTEENLRKAVHTAAQASRAKNEFLANMTHEIRTPLNVLIGTLGLLVEDEPVAARRDSLQVAKSSAVSLLNLMNDIISLSTMDVGRFRLADSAFSLGACIDVHLYQLRKDADARGLVLTSVIAPEIPEILRGDQLRLGQVFTHLVGNAIKFTERGQINVLARVESRSAREISVIFVVSDTGMGISSEHQEMIFSPFIQADPSSTRSYGGVGLGLTIARRIIEMMGGRIWVQSEPGKGSSFFFSVPFGIGMED